MLELVAVTYLFEKEMFDVLVDFVIVAVPKVRLYYGNVDFATDFAC